MNEYYIPINKGNYSMDTQERELEFEAKKGFGWEKEYKDYRSKWISHPKNKFVSDYPLLVDIELSSICNLKCPMCYTISEGFKEKVNTKRMDWDLFVKIIDEIGGKVPAIRLSLRGEATLNRNFVECIKYAKQKGIKEVSTLTHGFKLSLPFFKKITDAGIDWITISVDGTNEIYNSIRKPLRFNDLLKKIKDISIFKKENNLKRPVIKIQGIWPAIEKNPQEFYDTFRECTDLIAFNPLIDYLGNDDLIEYIDNFSCPQQYQRLVIGADGKVMKCSNDEENVEVVGDLNEETVFNVWHGKKMNDVRKLHNQKNGFMKSEICRKCYLPRKTKDQISKVDDREFIVKNYTLRTNIIGK